MSGPVFNHNTFFHRTGDTKVIKAEPKTERLNPNMAWRVHRRMKALAVDIGHYECDVCGGPCDKYDTIELDSGVYYVCCGECTDEAEAEF